MDTELERLLADDYLADLETRSLTDLRALRAECQAVESQLSYLRRLIQGRHDITTGEIERRSSGGDPDDVHGLVERLPEILSDRIHGPGPGRPPTDLAPQELTGTLVEKLAGIAEAVAVDAPHTLGDAELAVAADQLGTLEQEVSALRRAMFDRIDAIQAELTRRYRDGEATVDDLLAGGS
jgi:hypothetical protein